MDAMGMLRKGDFVKVAASDGFRSGQDGMVVSPPDADGNLGMMFHLDRCGAPVLSHGVSGSSWPTPWEGVEEWHVSELDLSSVDR